MSAETARDRVVAFFDFDQTLARVDTLPLFLRTLAGEAGFKRALKAGVAAAVMRPLRWRDAGRAAIFRSVLRDVRLEQAIDVAHTLAKRLEWKGRIVDILRARVDAGDRVVIATGSLSFYVPVFLKAGDCPCHHLLSTEIEFENGRLTGELIGPSCTRAGKAGKIRTFLTEEGPFERIIAYGNLPDDRRMFQMADEAFSVSKHPQDESLIPFSQRS